MLLRRVGLQVASVSHVLPTENAGGVFAGLVDKPPASIPGPAESDAQETDSKKRIIAWDAERAVGMSDSSKGSQVVEPWLPLGIRTKDDDIVPLSLDEMCGPAQPLVTATENDYMDVDHSPGMSTQANFYAGMEESIPTRLPETTVRLPYCGKE